MSSSEVPNSSLLSSAVPHSLESCSINGALSSRTMSRNEEFSSAVSCSALSSRSVASSTLSINSMSSSALLPSAVSNSS